MRNGLEKGMYRALRRRKSAITCQSFFTLAINVNQDKRIMQCEGFEILPCWQVLKLAIRCFIDAGRRHYIPVSETKDFITHRPESSMHFMFMLVSLVPQVPWE